MLALGLAGGYWLALSRATQPGSPAAGAKTPVAREPLFYRHPMNPSVTSPTPKKDEMGMDYVPVYAGADESGPAGTVRIDPVTVQNIGVRTAKAEWRALSRRIRAVGYMDYSEERLARLNPKTDGWVEELRVSNTGEHVRKETILLSLYSPQLVTAQQEYLLALRNLAALKASPYPDMRRNAQALVEAARARLAFLDVPEHQIHELEQTGEVRKDLHIHSPFDGVLVSVGARPGQYVTPETELYKIANLDKIWVYVNVYEDELPWVRVGDAAEMEVTAIPGQVFKGRVIYVYPAVDPKTRTAYLRLEFDNRDGLLKPDMYAEVSLHTGARAAAVVVPAEAVLRSGARERVFVVRAPGKYEPREVSVGVTAEGWTEVTRGVAPGEEVVVSAQFLIDSESKLKEATAKLREPAAPPPAEDLDMSTMELPAPAPAVLDKSRHERRAPQPPRSDHQHPAAPPPEEEGSGVRESGDTPERPRPVPQGAGESEQGGLSEGHRYD